MKVEAAETIKELLREEWGKPVKADMPLVGYFCTYTPVELICAAGAQARRIFPPEPGSSAPMDLHRVAAHLPGFVCPFIKRALENALAGDAPRMDGLLHAYSCDVTCGAFNIWKEVFKPDVAVMLHQPYRFNPASLEYYLEELRGSARALQVLTGREVTVDGLLKSATVFNEQRGMLRRLAAGLIRGEGPPADVMLELVLLCQLRPVEQANGLLERVCELAASTAGVANELPPPGDPRRVLVSGSVLEDSRPLKLIKEAGGCVVADDLCTGSRWYAEDVGTEGDPWEAVAERYLGRIPCPTRDSAAAREQRLADIVETSQAGSVLFLVQKFCDPHLADIPLLRESLTAAGIPSMVLELEDEGPSGEQWKTRLETFFHLGREGSGT